ncbi:hypothetical protein [Pseudomonas sp. Teo4]|nr:hypothetical protein [Pseudomonas sp. Teo4]
MLAMPRAAALDKRRPTKINHSEQATHTQVLAPNILQAAIL